MTADEPVAGVPRLCARRADCTRPRGHDDECGPDRADTGLADLRAEVERLTQDIDECWVPLYHGEVHERRQAEYRAEKAEAERDALQRQVANVRALANARQDQFGSATYSGTVLVSDLRAALDGPAAPPQEPHPTGYDGFGAPLYAHQTGPEPHPTPEACPDCHHIHTPDGCTGPLSPSDLWAGVTPSSCDCDWDGQQDEEAQG